MAHTLSPGPGPEDPYTLSKLTCTPPTAPSVISRAPRCLNVHGILRLQGACRVCSVLRSALRHVKCYRRWMRNWCTSQCQSVLFGATSSPASAMSAAASSSPVGTSSPATITTSISTSEAPASSGAAAVESWLFWSRTVLHHLCSLII